MSLSYNSTKSRTENPNKHADREHWLDLKLWPRLMNTFHLRTFDTMKGLIFGLVVILLLLQYKLWFADGNVDNVWQLKQKVDNQIAENITLRERNAALGAEVDQLKQGKQAVEERARMDLGMVKRGEVFYRFVPSDGKAAKSSN